MSVQDKKFAVEIEAKSWEEALDRAVELNLIPCGPIIQMGDLDTMSIEYENKKDIPPCPINIRHRFED